MESSLQSMVLYPFFGAFILGGLALTGWKQLDRWVGAFASFMIGLSFVQATRMASLHLGADSSPLDVQFGEWIVAPGLNLLWGLRIDSLSSIMTLVVSGVGLLIHIYSIGYMAHDEARPRYFAYLNLFCGFMLLLVSAPSLPILFIGWEGVGLCSYLLIGFWFRSGANAAAGKKAFIVNRIGDAGFLIAMFFLYRSFGTLEIQAIASHPNFSDISHSLTGEMIALLLFVGCVGKSAQFPLYVWLPDAMAGPTPVSALIHAATMVTAGVYLIARMSFLYAATPVASEVVAVVGAFTALFAATIAAVQNDIKKVLAFSTVSQLGFMVLAMGVGAYGEGIFHLVTHAFFKALLFLAAGSIIHALHGEQNILRMGGLRTYLVSTILVFALGYAAIIGIPLFSGYFSKDEILYEVLASGHTTLFWIGVTAALFTAYYMTRLFYFVFLGTPRASAKDLQEIHESPAVMVIPMWILGILSLGGGLFGVRNALHKVVAQMPHTEQHPLEVTELQMGLLLSFAVIVVVVTTLRYCRLRNTKEAESNWAIRLRGFVARQYEIDAVAMWFGGSLTRLIAGTLRFVDVYVVDRMFNSLAEMTRGAGSAVARLQGGWVQAYAVIMGVGCLIVTWLLLRGGWGG